MGIISRSRAAVPVALFVLAIAAPAFGIVTISGTVSGPGGVVEGVEVSAWIPFEDHVITTTDSAGQYSVSLSPGNVHMRFKAPVEARLGQRTFAVGEVTEDLELDVELEAGHLLSGTVLWPDGRTVDEHMGVELMPLPAGFSHNEWLIAEVDPDAGSFQIVAPADVYWIRALPERPWHGVPRGVDLSTSDVTGIVLALSQHPVNPNPERPPNATKITVGDIDDIGEATVTGAAGAALPLSQVVLINLSSTHQATTEAAADGSFSARLFAPPGSAILVKHGPASERWINLENGAWQGLGPMPSTIFHVPFDHGAGPGLAFAQAGPVEFQIDNQEGELNWVGAAWSVGGTMSPGGGPYSPGESFDVEGTIRIYSHGFDTTTNLGEISMQGFGGLLLVFDNRGNPVGSSGAFMSTLLTPTGLPVQGEPRASVAADFEPIVIEQWQWLGDNTIEGVFDITVTLENDTPGGTYLPTVFLHFDGVPTTTDWVAGTVYHTPLDAHEIVLPPIVVDDGSLVWDGDQPRRHLIWRLLMENPTLGIRGTGALEDADIYQFASQIVTQHAPYVVPPVDRETGLPLSYRIEPFLPMLSFTDRRLPGPPLLRFELPGGVLGAIIESPSGGIQEIGPAPFKQSAVRTATTSAGLDLNPGTTQYNDPYSLTTGNEDFEVAFDRYGPHFVILNGELEDPWGNRYTGGGTYELWVAHPLDLEPGMLPGTPLAVGDAIDPAVRITPPVPAEISWTVTLVPDSDPDRATTQTIGGFANDHGSFSSNDPPIVMTEPGEYRVNLVARHVGEGGALYMAAMTWGGIVMTPPGEAELVAHGRRGLDSLEYVPASWFVASQDLQIPDGAISHAFNPYYGGDILWSRMSDGPYGGDALLIVGTVQDTVGDIQAAIESRLDVDPDNPEMQERLDAGELPLFISTASGRSPLAFPEEIDLAGYAYRSSQRPGVRVRELVTQDWQDGGYWRLDTLYDDQPGVGILGDQPNDYKFQYVGAVYRDLVSGHNEYVGQGTGWVFIPDDDPVGTRAMPPYAGPGNGGWTTLGGPILRLGGEDIHVLLVPTGARPGTVLHQGDTLHFAGHIMPTLPSQVAVTITAPSGTVHELDGEANPVGYYYVSTDDIVIDEPGPWSVEVTVWHDGQCSGGSTVPPYPTGSTLGSADGTYWIYVPSPDAPPLEIGWPRPGFLRIRNQVGPMTVRGAVPDDLEDVTVHYTIAMPGQVLESGQVSPIADYFEIVYDPVLLHQEFPNLDLIARHEARPGLSDTIWIGVLLEGRRGDARDYRAAVVTLQGEEVSVGDRLPPLPAAPRTPSGRRP
jgi:hypothetical protein